MAANPLSNPSSPLALKVKEGDRVTSAVGDAVVARLVI